MILLIKNVGLAIILLFLLFCLFIFATAILYVVVDIITNLFD